MGITVGLQGSASFTVGDEDTAIAVGSGDVPVLGTPRLLAWCEAVTVQALAPGLDDSQTSVGFRIRLDHLAPTPVGGIVEIRAEVAEVDGRQVTLTVEATETGRSGSGGADEATRIGEGSVVRVVVDRQRFVDRLG